MSTSQWCITKCSYNITPWYHSSNASPYYWDHYKPRLCGRTNCILEVWSWLTDLLLMASSPNVISLWRTLLMIMKLAPLYGSLRFSNTWLDMRIADFYAQLPTSTSVPNSRDWHENNGNQFFCISKHLKISSTWQKPIEMLLQCHIIFAVISNLISLTCREF